METEKIEQNPVIKDSQLVVGTSPVVIPNLKGQTL
jgi:hypothetical protein